MDLSESIKHLRTEKNMTQGELASLLGVSFQAVSRWETGYTYPDVELLPLLASTLGVSLDELFRIDEKSEEFKIDQYNKLFSQLTDSTEKIRLTKKYMAELPSNVFLKTRLLNLYKYVGYDYAKGKLDEMRKLCRYIMEHSTDDEWYQCAALRAMVAVEDDDKLDEWLSLFTHKSIQPASRALIERYSYRNEIDKYNTAVEEDIVSKLDDIFIHDFAKLSGNDCLDPASRAQGQKNILKIIDVMRDPSTDSDAWLEKRAFAYLRLAGGEFGSGDIESGFASLEKSVDLYLLLAGMPEGTELSYNCSSLDLLKYTVTTEAVEMVKRLYACLNDPQPLGWYWFIGVRGEERYQKQLDRVKPYC